MDPNALDVLEFPAIRERLAAATSTELGAELASTCLIDRSPPPPPRDPLARQGYRPAGAGRPTKRQRRDLDRARGRRA